MVPTAGALHVLVEPCLMLLWWPQAVLPAKMLLACSTAWRGLQGRVPRSKGIAWAASVLYQGCGSAATHLGSVRSCLRFSGVNNSLMTVGPVAAGEGWQEAGLVAGAGGLSSSNDGARCCFYS